MAGVFKSLDKSDVRITPFRTHKEWFNADYNTFAMTKGVLMGGGGVAGYNLKSSLGIQLSGSNYFYCVSVDGSDDGIINLLDIDDNFNVIGNYPGAGATPKIFFNLLTGLGNSQSNLAFYNSVNTELLALDSSLATLSNISIGLDLAGASYAKLSYIPNLSDPSTPADFVVVNGGDSGYFYSADLDGSSVFGNYGDLITGSPEAGNYFDSVHITGSYMISLFESSTYGNVYLGLFDANYNNPGIITSEVFSPPSLGSSICPTRQMVFQHNGDSQYGFLFTTLKAPEKRYLYITHVFVRDPITSNTTIYDTIDGIPDAVSILTAKSYYRNATYSFNEPVHVASADGLLYLNVSRTVTGTNDVMTYDKIINFTPYIGTSGRIISATINTDHDLTHPGSPTLITLLASDNFYVNPSSVSDRLNKGCLFTITYNLTEDVIYDPVYIGNKKHSNNAPFIGDDFSVASNFTSEYLSQGVIGMGYSLQQFTNAITNYVGNYFYKFNR